MKDCDDDFKLEGKRSRILSQSNVNFRKTTKIGWYSY